jgi:uncharacterized protein YrzB (UPF0473 family)
MSEDVNNVGEELDNIIILNDEEGNEVKFEFLDLIELDGEEYVVLLPTEEEEDSEEVVILKVEDSEDEEMESYVSVDDEETLNTVFEMFKEKFKDEFNFVDDED